MSKKSKRVFTEEFKQQAVSLADRSSVAVAAEQLGINASNLHRWVKQLSAEAMPSKAEKESLEEEVRRLQKENRELKDVNHILKRAAAFFSQDHLK